MRFTVKKISRILLPVLFLGVFLSLSGCIGDGAEPAEDALDPPRNYDMKPVIYLYPQTPTQVTVKLDYKGEFTCTYPEYGDGWTVTAYPDGRLYNHADQREYTTLFWEGRSDTRYDMSEGFVVAGEDTAAFLEDKLEFLGLSAKERNDFIVFWLPKMKDNPYNFISFQTDVYTQSAKLYITPEPDSLVRVFMTYSPLQEPVQVPRQTLKRAQRSGFTVVEWGGRVISQEQ